MAAENHSRTSTTARWPRGFNEAAANGRGKLAEAAVTHPRRLRRFNEAAANGRGKRSRGGTGCGGSPRFNEAAANGRGKLEPAESRLIARAPLQ